MPKKTKPGSAAAKRASTHLKDMKPAPISRAEAKLVKGGTLPPDKQRQIARDM